MVIGFGKKIHHEIKFETKIELIKRFFEQKFCFNWVQIFFVFVLKWVIPQFCVDFEDLKHNNN